MSKNKNTEMSLDEIARAKIEYDRSIKDQKYTMIDLWGAMGVISIFIFIVGLIGGAQWMGGTSLLVGILGLVGYKIFKGRE